jgi:hypothetical protein
MHFYGLNWFAVLAATLSTMAVGFLWYSPVMFAKPWMALMGVDCTDKEKLEKMKKEAGPMYGMALVASFFSAVVLALVLSRLGAIAPMDMMRGLKITLGIWLGFVTTVQFTNTLFGKKPMKLFMIDTGYQLVCYLVMGTILVLWQ